MKPFSALLFVVLASCKPVAVIDTSMLQETTFLKKNCSGERDVTKLSTFSLGDYVVTRFEPDACDSVGKSKKKNGSSLALAGEKASKGLAVLIGGDGKGNGVVEPRVGTNLQKAANVYKELGYDTIRVTNPTSAADVQKAIRAKYPNGYDGAVETIVHGHGGINSATGLHEISVNSTDAAGRPKTVGIPTVNLLQGAVVNGQGDRTAMISSCQSGQVCNNLSDDPALASAFNNVLTSSHSKQLSQDYPTKNPGDPTIEAGLGNYLAFKQNPLLFDVNKDGNVTGSEFTQKAHTPGDVSLEPAALLIPTSRPNTFVEVGQARPSGLEQYPAKGPNVLTAGEGNTVVESRPVYFPQEMQVLNGDNLMYSSQSAPANSQSFENMQ